MPKTLTFKKILKDLALVIMIRSCNDMFSSLHVYKIRQHKGDLDTKKSVPVNMKDEHKAVSLT